MIREDEQQFLLSKKFTDKTQILFIDKLETIQDIRLLLAKTII